MADGNGQMWHSINGNEIVMVAVMNNYGPLTMPTCHCSKITDIPAANPPAKEEFLLPPVSGDLYEDREI
jgi:hypothetical protein